MSHWAELDENNIVIRVTKGDNDDPNGDEGYMWLINNLGGRWVKASYNTRLGTHLLDGIPLRKNYPGPGYYYDEKLDAFIPPKPEGMNSWILNEEKGVWEPPIPYPGEILDNPLIVNVEYIWDETKISWIKQGNGIIDDI